MSLYLKSLEPCEYAVSDDVWRSIESTLSGLTAGRMPRKYVALAKVEGGRVINIAFAVGKPILNKNFSTDSTAEKHRDLVEKVCNERGIPIRDARSDYDPPYPTDESGWQFLSMGELVLLESEGKISATFSGESSQYDFGTDRTFISELNDELPNIDIRFDEKRL